MNSVTANLITAKNLIKDPKNWCQEYYAVDDLGNSIDPLDSQACRYCSSGSIIKVLGKTRAESCSNTSEWNYLNDACGKLYDCNPSGANDSLDHESMMRAFDLAIELSNCNVE